MDRLREFVHPHTPIGRRARTLNLLSACSETVALARAGLGRKTGTASLDGTQVGGHGFAMVPDAASEALALLSDDVVLKLGMSAVVDPLRKDLEIIKSANTNLTERDLAHFDQGVGLRLSNRG